MKNQVKNLLRIIRFFPLFIILIMSIIVITILINEQKREIQVEKINIEKQFIQDEKKRIKLNVDSAYNYIKLHKDIAESDLKKDIQSKINNVHKIISNIYINNKNKKSKNKIIQQIKEAVDTIRYDNGNGYFSIHTLEGINILQPVNRSFEGTNIFNRKDSKGTHSIQKAIEIAKSQGEGFFTWFFPKPNSGTKEFEKIGIVKKFEPYNLIITTAVYKKDFLIKLKKQTLNYISQLKYKNDRFIYIVSFNGKVIYHPSKELMDVNIFNEEKFSHLRDSFKQLISKKDIDRGDYTLIKPTITQGKNIQDSNITYSKKLNNWEWIISTSFKLSDVNYIIENMKIVQEEKYENYKKDMIFYGLIFTIFFLIISYLISKLLEKEFLKYQFKIEEEKDTLILSQKITKVGHWKYEIATKKEYLSEEIKIMFGVKNIKDDIFIDYLEKVLHKDDLNRVMNAFNYTLSTKKDFNQIYRIHRPDNEIRWISSKATLNENKGYIKGVAQDITELKKLEFEKKQKDDILYQQSKMAAMGEMLGNIAHQWRQPLSTISTASTGAKLQKQMGLLNDEQLYKSLTIINDSVQYLSETIDDFGGFFNPKYNIKKEFHIIKAINKTIKLVNSQFNAKNIELIKNIQNHKLTSIENEIIQVLINILNNARDAFLFKENQRRLVFLNTYKKENTMYLEILDNAGGIKSNIINRIFEPYFTTKQKTQGTGIGLYMSQDIIRNHLEGSIIVSNEKYVYENINYSGAKFIIKIPF